MAANKNSNNIIADLTGSFIKGTSTEVVDIITFVEANWGFNIKLTMAQRVLLKAFYGIPLDDTDVNPVYDYVKEKIVGHFTEKSFMRWLYENKKCNYPDVPQKKMTELVLVAGRRSGKCRSKDDIIHTSCGIMTFRELLERKNNGQKDIHIITYSSGSYKRNLTNKFEIWDNGEKECLTIKTNAGHQETSSKNHPYLVWRENDFEPKFLNLEEIKIGDSIAVSKKMDIFGDGGIGVNRAKILGYLQGDGGITHEISFTTANASIAEELKELIEGEFKTVDFLKKKSKFAYCVSRKLKKKNDEFGSRKNDVKEWLKDNGVYGVKSKEKKVPECILKGNKEEISAFISRLFACDGSIQIDSKTSKYHTHPRVSIGYCSASETMVRQVRSLLLKFGIQSVFRKRNVKCSGKEYDKNGEKFVACSLDINGYQDIREFSKQIGIFSKQDKLEKGLKLLEVCKDSLIWYEFLPIGAWNAIKDHIEKTKCSKSSICGENRLRYNVRPCIRKHKEYLKNINVSKNDNICYSDIVWDEVKSIENSGIKETVDLCVEDTHIIGGEIISHNSLMSACIIGYEFYKLVKHQDPAKFYGKPAQASIKVLNVAPTDEQAGVVFDAASTAISHCPTLKNRLSNQTQTYFALFTDEDFKQGKNKASLSFITGGCSSNGLRGHDAIVVCMDEMAFFLANGGKFSGDEVYGALTPSTGQFRDDGKTICISSPYAKYGKFYDLYKDGMEEKESTTLVFQMYTAMMNPENITTDFLKQKRKRDRNKFLAEFCAEFSDSVSAWIDDQDEFLKCVDKDFNIPRKGKADTRYYAGLDIGMKNDGTAISIVHEEGGEFLLDYSNVWFSGQSDIWDLESSFYKSCDRYKNKSILSMEDIAAEIKELNRWFPIKEGILDQHQGYSIVEFLERENLKMFRVEHFNDTKNAECYAIAKRLYADGLLKLWDHPILVPELLTLEQERKGAGVDDKKESFVKLEVRAPFRKGAHDDISESYVRALFLAYTGKRSTSNNKAMSFHNQNPYTRSYTEYLKDKYKGSFTNRPTNRRFL